jgi:hypothetical protein
VSEPRTLLTWFGRPPSKLVYAVAFVILPYVSVCALVTGLFFFYMRETRTVDIDGVAMRA